MEEIYMIYKRTLDLADLLKKKSFFLFGPRSVGKTTLIQNRFPKCRLYNLLDSRVYRRLIRRPSLILEENKNNNKLIVIDEIQKLPELLDEVHHLIQSQNKKFLLTGSSSRKLKRSGVNFLGGRAWRASLFPLTYKEIPRFDLIKYLNRGGLPDIYNSRYYEEELENYIALYLKEEIMQEALTRNVQVFSEFLDSVAISNGQEINYEKFSRDLQISPSTLKGYMSILDDTLLGFRLPGFVKSRKRKATARSKYYLFDIGVTNSFCRRGRIKKGGELFGKAFEHFIVLELRAYLSYKRKNLNMFYWRSTSNMEVDLIIGNKLAIEIKSSSLIQSDHLRGLRALKEEGIIKKYFVISLDEARRVTKDNIEIFPWQTFLNELWKDKII